MPDRPGVFGDSLILGHKNETFRKRLPNQHPIKWIVVDGRKGGRCDAMLPCHGQLPVVCIQQCSSEYGRVKPEISLAHGTFDADFPDTGCTEEELVVPVFDEIDGFGRQRRGLGTSPQENMRIEQQLHTWNIVSISS